jgi:hypothetical protein
MGHPASGVDPSDDDVRVVLMGVVVIDGDPAELAAEAAFDTNLVALAGWALASRLRGFGARAPLSLHPSLISSMTRRFRSTESRHSMTCIMQM